MKILMVSPKGERYMLKQGLSWTLFFFGFYAIPLMYRKMYKQACLLLLSWIALVVSLVAVDHIGLSKDGANAISFLLEMPYTGFSFWMLFRGNKWTYDHLISDGWQECGVYS